MKRQRLLGILVLTSLFSSVASTAFSWGPAGHMLVADLAYRRMKPEQRLKLVAVLKAAFDADPAKGLANFEKDLTEGLRPGATEEEKNRYIFIKAATWPDIIRDRTHPCNAEFHKSVWHFIDFPFKPPGDPISLPADPVPTEPGKEPEDAVSAIRFCRSEILKAETTPRVRAARLCFLLHLIGDIHQPLHAAAFFSEDGLKRGDQGGNLLLFRKSNADGTTEAISIHSLFDEVFGSKTRLAGIASLGNPIELDPKWSPEALADSVAITDELQWAKESRKLAAKFAYLDGLIDAARGKSSRSFQQGGGDPSTLPPLPAGYEANALKIAEARVALAGLRLASALEALVP